VSFAIAGTASAKPGGGSMMLTCEWAFASGTTPGVKNIVKVAATAAVATAVIAFAVMDLNM